MAETESFDFDTQKVAQCPFMVRPACCRFNEEVEPRHYLHCLHFRF